MHRSINYRDFSGNKSRKAASGLQIGMDILSSFWMCRKVKGKDLEERKS